VTGEAGRPPSAQDADRGARGWAVPWSGVDVAMAFLAGLLLAELARGLLAAALPEVAFAAVAPLLGGLGLIVGVIGWLGLRYPATLPRVVGPGPLRASVVVQGVGHGVAAFVVLNLGVAALFALVADILGVDLPPVQESLRETLLDPERAFGGLVYALTIAVIAEELFFRGLLFRVLRNAVGRWAGILLAGALFGAVHYQPDPLGWAYTFGVMFVFGSYLAWAFDRYRHLAVVLVMHAVFNALAVVAILQAWG
jgi:membrane protease YdiL (CAAX protease family)